MRASLERHRKGSQTQQVSCPLLSILLSVLEGLLNDERNNRDDDEQGDERASDVVPDDLRVRPTEPSEIAGLVFNGVEDVSGNAFREASEAAYEVSSPTHRARVGLATRKLDLPDKPSKRLRGAAKRHRRFGRSRRPRPSPLMEMPLASRLKFNGRLEGIVTRRASPCTTERSVGSGQPLAGDVLLQGANFCYDVGS